MSEPLEQFSSTRKCAWCGKLITVLWPHQWAYKRGSEGNGQKYLCSWSCLRLFDREKEEKEKKRMAGRRVVSVETEAEAVRVALEGGDPLQVLENGGATDPAKKWYQMKVKMRDTDPETLAKLPARITRKDSRGPVEFVPTVTVSGALRVETPEASRVEVAEVPEKPKICKPVNYDGFDVRAVSGDFGTYYLDSQTKSGRIYFDYSNKAGDELSMEVSQWRCFLREMKHAAEILGVEL